MAKKVTNPVSFTREQLTANREAQRLLHDLLPVLDKADECGVPTEGYRAIASGLQAQLRSIEQNFMSDIS